MSDHRYNFGPFSFDSRTKILTTQGVSVLLGHRSILLLEKLLEANGQLVTKSELMDAGWPGIILEESNLTVQISNLRKSLAEHSGGAEWITTQPRRGYQLHRSAVVSSSSARQDDAAAAHVPPVQLSIAVLPFSCAGHDSDQQYFADGLAEDLITDLSKLPGLTVIARHSSFAYRDHQGSVGEVGQQLGVRYIIEGSVRRSTDRVRITVQVVDALTGIQIWADRFDRRLSDVFELQDDIVGRVVNSFMAALPGRRFHYRQRANNIEAYDLFVQGRSSVTVNPEQNLVGQQLLQRAIELDPGFSDAHAWLAVSHHFPWAYWGGSIEMHRAQSRQHADRAISLDPQNAIGHAILGVILIYDANPGQGAGELATALRIDPNYADAWVYMADLHVLEGRAQEGISCIRSGLRLNPNPPGFYFWFLGYAAYAAGQYDEAIQSLQRKETQELPAQRTLAASLAQMGRIEEARTVARRFMATYPSFLISDWAATQPFRREEDRQSFVAGYVKAGLPL